MTIAAGDIRPVDSDVVAVVDDRFRRSPDESRRHAMFGVGPRLRWSSGEADGVRGIEVPRGAQTDCCGVRTHDAPDEYACALNQARDWRCVTPDDAVPWMKPAHPLAGAPGCSIRPPAHRLDATPPFARRRKRPRP